jgi:hypothetical protein
MMCGKDSMAMNYTGMKGEKGSRCCDGTASNMSKCG